MVLDIQGPQPALLAHGDRDEVADLNQLRPEGALGTDPTYDRQGAVIHPCKIGCGCQSPTDPERLSVG